MNIKQISEQLNKYINEENKIYSKGTNINGKNWTEEIIEEKTINFLGQDLTYQKIYHHTDNANPEDFTERDRYSWVIKKEDEDKINKINLYIRQDIKARLGINELGLVQASRQIGFPLEIGV